MIYLINVFTIIAAVVYCYYYMNRKKEYMSVMDGMVITMAIVSVATTAIGVNVAYVVNQDMTASTIISIIFGVPIGYTVGKPSALLASIEGMTAGMMGGMMGAMIGVMVVKPAVIVIFMDVIFIIAFIGVLNFIYKKAMNELTKPKENLIEQT